MSIKKKLEWKGVIYFCTFTCQDWIPLIDNTGLYEFIYKWFDLLKTKGIKIIGYVMMPNHVHLLVYLPEHSATIDKIIGNGKRFMAYEIVKRLKQNKNLAVLYKLREAVPEKERAKNKIHNVFEPSFDAKCIVSEKLLIQKLNYMHLNPVRGKWKLTDDYRKFHYSSAGFYELEEYEGYQITHYMEI
jgi:REP element-mobilizing transposase RayT